MDRYVKALKEGAQSAASEASRQEYGAQAQRLYSRTETLMQRWASAFKVRASYLQHREFSHGLLYKVGYSGFNVQYDYLYLVPSRVSACCWLLQAAFPHSQCGCVKLLFCWVLERGLAC